MSEFKGVSFMLGAVSETSSLRDTVNTVLKICDHKDITEIIIGWKLVPYFITLKKKSCT